MRDRICSDRAERPTALSHLASARTHNLRVHPVCMTVSKVARFFFLGCSGRCRIHAFKNTHTLFLVLSYAQQSLPFYYFKATLNGYSACHRSLSWVWIPPYPHKKARQAWWPACNLVHLGGRGKRVPRTAAYTSSVSLVSVRDFLSKLNGKQLRKRKTQMSTSGLKAYLQSAFTHATRIWMLLGGSGAHL